VFLILLKKVEKTDFWNIRISGKPRFKPSNSPLWIRS